MSTSDDAGYSGRLRSSTRPIQEAQGEGRERSRSRESRRGGLRDENPDDDSDTNTSHPQGTPTDRIDSPVQEEEAEKPLPGAGASRRQISPASRERHQLTSSHSTEHHRRHLDSPRSTERLSQSFGDQGTHAGPSDSASEFLGPSEHSTTQTRPCTGVRNADGTMTNVDAARMKPSTRRGPLLARRPAR